MKEKVVACCGIFDGDIHPGHLFFLNYAKSLGSKLYVFMGPDSFIIQSKNRNPIYSFDQRISNVKGTKLVDYIVRFKENDNKYNFDLIYTLNPDVFCLGHDQDDKWTKELEKNLIENDKVIKRAPAHKREVYSTTSIHKCVIS